MKILKSFICCLLSLTCFTEIGYAKESTDSLNESEITLSEINEEQVQKFNNLGIECISNENGQIEIIDKSTENIENANNILARQKNVRKSYPTAYAPFGGYNYTTSKIFKAATRSAFSAAITGFIRGRDVTPAQVAATAIIGFGPYYFQTAGEENVHFKVVYYYRENSAGYFSTHNGSFIGDYTIRKQVNTSKNSDFSTGQRKYFYNNQTMLNPPLI